MVLYEVGKEVDHEVDEEVGKEVDQEVGERRGANAQVRRWRQLDFFLAGNLRKSFA